MTEAKVKCEACGGDVTNQKVLAYSKEHFDNHVYCYPCQQKKKDDPDWTYIAPKKEVKKEAGSTELVSDAAMEAIAANNEAEIHADLNDEFTRLRDKMGVGNFELLYEWIKSEYGKDTFESLSIEEKKAVLTETEQEIEKRNAKKSSASDGAAVKSAKVVDAEVVESENKEELIDVEYDVITGEEKWTKRVEIDEGEFSFLDEGDRLRCRGDINDKVYDLDVSVPSCSCLDFQVNKRKNEWCKHLKAASVAGYSVKELEEIPEEVTNALAKPEKPPQKEVKAKKEEVVAMTVLDKQIEIPIQTPAEMIMSEEKALDMIKKIIGDKPKKEDVIESYAGIEELNADVVLSLSAYLGIQYRIVEKEIEKTRISIGQVYRLGATNEQIAKYGKIAEILPEVDVVTRCKVTVAAAWKDKRGNTRLSVGVKEEFLTPHDLLDISKRGATFIETKAITKASKKALLSVLPVTHDGLKSKIKRAYRWE